MTEKSGTGQFREWFVESIPSEAQILGICHYQVFYGRNDQTSCAKHLMADNVNEERET